VPLFKELKPTECVPPAFSPLPLPRPPVPLLLPAPLATLSQSRVESRAGLIEAACSPFASVRGRLAPPRRLSHRRNLTSWARRYNSIADALVEESYRPGATIIEQGAPADAMYILAAGA
jgi:hypothetical protein